MSTRRALPAAVLACVFLLGGCFTGERPTLVDPPPGGEIGQPSGDANADTVLTLLEAPVVQPFTARYELTLRFGGTVTQGAVTEDGFSRRSVTIGGIRYLDTGIRQTCETATGTCEEGILDARTSDSGFTSTFDRLAPAQRLRLAVSRKGGATTASTETVAGLPATCVTVPVGSGTETYCALQVGGIARWDAADLLAQLTSYEGTASEALFNPS